MRRVVIFQTQVRQERRSPGRLRVLLQKAGQAREIIRAVASRIGSQSDCQSGIFGRSRLAADHDQRFLKDTGAEKLLRGRIDLKLKNGFRRFQFWEGAIGDGLCTRRVRHKEENQERNTGRRCRVHLLTNSRPRGSSNKLFFGKFRTGKRRNRRAKLPTVGVAKPASNRTFRFVEPG